MVNYDLGKVVGDKGEQGDDGNGIVSITKTSTSGLVDTYTILFTNGTTTTFEVTNGSSGIADIVTSWSATLHDDKVPSEKLAKNSLDAKLDNAISSTAVTIASNDNIVITDYSDSNKVKRVSSILASQMKDSNAHSNIGSSANASQSTINTNIDTALSGKANSSSLSTVATTGSYNDLTNKPTIPSITGLEETANKVTSWSTTTTDAHYPSERLVKTSLDAKADSSSLSTVATSGSYNDLSNKPSIPTKTSDLQNDAGYLDSNDVGAVALSNDYADLSNKPTLFSGSYADLSNKPSYTPTVTSSTTGAYKLGSINISGSDVDIYGKDTHQSLANYVQKSSISGLLKNDGSVDTTQYLSTLPSHNHDDRYYTESEVDTALNGKQDTLVSGTSIKTINSESILGSGNIVIQGGSSVDIVTAWESTPSDSKVASEKLTKDSLDLKVDFECADGNTTFYFDDSLNGMVELFNGVVDFNVSNGNLRYNNYKVATLNDIPSVSGMLTTSDVVDNLTSTSTTAPLSAKQGKVLNDLIGQAITYINQ